MEAIISFFLYIYLCIYRYICICICIDKYSFVLEAQKKEEISLGTVRMKDLIKHRYEENRLAVRRYFLPPAGRLNIVSCHGKTYIYYHIRFVEHQSVVSVLYLL